MASNSKTTGHRTQQTKISESGVAVRHIWGSSHLIDFNVILVLFGVLQKFGNSKTAGHRAKRIENFDSVEHV